MTIPDMSLPHIPKDATIDGERITIMRIIGNADKDKAGNNEKENRAPEGKDCEIHFTPSTPERRPMTLQQVYLRNSIVSARNRRSEKYIRNRKLENR